jgi:hypothetical protein
MSTPASRPLSTNAQRVAFWLRLFRVGVFEDNYLDVGRLDAGAFEDVRDELEEAGLFEVDHNLKLAGRPYLRLGKTTPPACPRNAFAGHLRTRYVGVYHAFTMPIRQAFHGQKPAHGMEIMELEEPNFRRAVAWARDLGDIAKMADLADVFAKYLYRAGRTDDLAAWTTWIAGEGPDEVAEAPVDEGDASTLPVAKAEPEKAPSPFAGLAGRGVGGPVTARLRGMFGETPPAPRVRRVSAAAPPEDPVPMEPQAASPEEPPAPQPPQESEGTRLQREGTAAVAAGDIAKATDLYLQALRSFQNAKDTAGVAETCALFGAMEEAAGRPDAARTWHERAKAMRS